VRITRLRHLICIGITHKTAPVWVRERLRPPITEQRALLDSLAGVAPQRAVLSTCGRFEIYAVTTRPHPDLWINTVAGTAQMSSDVLAPYIRLLCGDACAEHLLRVAAGLESQIIGEPHILRQVREAFQLACEARSIGPLLSTLFRTAIHTGKRVRSETGINPSRRSFAQLAVDRIESACRPIESKTVVVIGSGRLAAEAAAGLAARRAGLIVVVNRSFQRARDLARRVGGKAADIEHLPDVLTRADAVVVCTASPTFIIDQHLLRHRTGNGITIIDLSLPRNVDPSVTQMHGVRLTHLDQLASPRHSFSGDPKGSAPVPHPDSLDAGTAAARRIVEQQLQRLRRWQRARVVAPHIRDLIRLADVHDHAVARRRKRATHRPIIRLVEAVTA